MRVAVLDLGKTNAKLALVETDDASERRVETTPTPVVEGEPYPHLDVDAIGAFLERTLARFAAEERVDALTVTTHGATVALLDETGALALPVLDYEHGGPDETRAAYEAVRPPFPETGSPALPGGLNVGAQLFWQAERHPEVFARVRTLLTWPQYWVYRLCGARANDLASLGAHTDLLDPRAARPSSLVARMGWERLMPPSCRPGERLGTLDPALAARTGLAPTTPVHAGIHDSNASLVPQLLGREGPVTVVSSGTWVIVMAVDGEPVALDERRDTLLNVDAFERPVPSARFMGGRERELALAAGGGGEVRGRADAFGEGHALEEAAADDGEDAFVDRAGAGASRDDGALERVLDGGPMLLPTLVPGCGPWPDACGGWHGDSAPLAPDEREAAIAAYLALVTAECVGLVGGRGRVVVEGPLATSVDYLRALDALIDLPVSAGASRTGTATGAAMLIARPRGSGAEKVTDSGSVVPAASSAFAARVREHAARWRRTVGGES